MSRVEKVELANSTQFDPAGRKGRNGSNRPNSPRQLRVEKVESTSYSTIRPCPDPTRRVEFEFDPARHSYHLDGIRLPSVTEILATQSRNVPEAFAPPDWVRMMDAARTRGRFVHAVLAGERPVDIPVAYRPFLDAGFAFLRESHIRIAYQEQPLGSARLGYAGTPDLIGGFHGRLTLFDWKTGSLPSTTGPQLAAYDDLIADQLDVSIERRYAVVLRANGTYRLHPYTDPSDATRWRQALLTWRSHHAD